MPDLYFPDSPAPFRPVNPWGRAVPRVNKTVRQPLYQLVVTRKGRGEIRFGPQMELQFVQEFYEAVLKQIRSGREKDLTNPHVVLCV